MDYRKEAKNLLEELEDLPRDEWVDVIEGYLGGVSEESIDEFIENRKDYLARDDKFMDYITDYIMGE